MRTIIKNVEVVLPGEAPLRGYVTIDNHLISEEGSGEPDARLLDSADRVVDGDGGVLMPGAIDTHVHFREPGLTHKADMAGESRAALAGGVTSWIDMPNTVPPTVSLDDFEAKQAIAAAGAVGNYSFFIAANGHNTDRLARLPFDRVPGVKLFLGQSTGNMAVDGDKAVAAVFEQIEAPIVVHAEDDAVIARNLERLRARYGEDLPVELHSRLRDAEACVRASERAMELAARYGSRLHLAHLSTAAECAMLDAGDLAGKRITAEVSPHHLWWTDADYSHRGARIKMNPSIKTAADRDALRQALVVGRLDSVATDHAPHLLPEKEGGLLKAVSGAPVVQFSMPMMLTLYNDPAFVAAKMADAPARLFGIRQRGRIAPGYYADLVLVRRAEHTVSDSEVLSKCGWTPLEGERLDWVVERVWVNGSEDGLGMPLSFR